MATRAEQLAEAPFTLCLSAGFFGFFAHTGVLQALEERGVRPSRVVGVSAGSLAGGLYGLGLTPAAIEERLVRLERREFWDPGLPIGGILRGRKFDSILGDLLPQGSGTQLDAGPIPVTVVVWELARRRLLRLSKGPAAPAIRASCALPGLFRPVRVAGRWCWDGGIEDRSGVSALKPDERALVCNLPHQVPWPEFGADALSVAQKGARAPRYCLEPQDLPKVTPFALERGGAALASARAQALAWLDAPAV